MVETICHIQTQSIDIEFLNPSFYAVQNMINHILVSQIQLHQIVIAFPAFIPQSVIIIGITTKINMKPAKIRGILSVLKYILKSPEASAHMIEHTIQNNSDTIVMQVFTYFLKILIGSQTTIYGVIISGIVTMRIRFKDR